VIRTGSRSGWCARGSASIAARISHLYQRIRELRGMNYGDYAYIEYFPHGMFQFQPDPNLGRQQQIFQMWLRPLRTNNDAHFATRAAMYELDKLVREGMTQEDFDATRNFLDKFASLLVKTQAARLGYQLDSVYYGIEPFADYVRKGLARLTSMTSIASSANSSSSRTSRWFSSPGTPAICARAS
jgi:zinc protease